MRTMILYVGCRVVNGLGIQVPFPWWLVRPMPSVDRPVCGGAECAQESQGWWFSRK